MQVSGIRESWFRGGRHGIKFQVPTEGDRKRPDRRPRPLPNRPNEPSYPVRITDSPRTRSHSNRFFPDHRLRLLLAGSALLVAMILLALTGAVITGRGSIYPQVLVLDVPVGGLSAQDAETRVAARLASLTASPVTLTLGERVWTPSLAEVGVNLDVPGSVAAAVNFGREEHRTTGLLHQARLAEKPFVVPLGIRFDDARFGAYVDRLETEIRVAPVNATLVMEGAHARIQPSKEGLTINRATLRNDLLEQIRGLQPMSVALTTQPVAPSVSDTMLAPIAAGVEQSLSQPMVLWFADRQWSLAPEDLGTLVTFDSGTEGTDPLPPAVTLDHQGLRDMLEGIVVEAESEPSDAHIDDSAGAPRLVPAVVGRRVDIDSLLTAVQAAFQNGEHAVALPVEETPPAVSTDAFLTQLGITHLLASGDSNFAGSETNREQNIRVATELVNFTLVPPGGVFSYNHVLGSIVEDPGFVPARATEGGVIGTSVGGGVCQVSTTVFRAALRAGLPIVEWWPHVHRSPFYEQGGWGPGFDASIAQSEFDPLNSSDFKFSNPTEGWLLVQATAQGETTLTVELYGSQTGYSVEIEDPVIEVTEWAAGAIEHVDPSLPAGTTLEDEQAQDGTTVVVVRRVLDANGNLISTDEFVSAYEAHGTVYRVSSDMAGTTGGAPI